MVTIIKAEVSFMHNWRACEGNPIQQANLAREMIEKKGWSHGKIGYLVDMPVDEIVQIEALLDLDIKLQVLVEIGHISAQDGYNILMGEPDRQDQVYQLSIRQWRQRPPRK